MESKPSLSQYFSESEAPPASQFFDEIGTVPTDMIQSVYLGENEGIKIVCYCFDSVFNSISLITRCFHLFSVKQTTAANLFTHNMTASFTQHKSPPEMTFTSVVPTVSGSTAVPATSLPDPSTFFDNIGPEPQFTGIKNPVASTDTLAQAMDGLVVKVILTRHLYLTLS